jgi:hypothetical protein
MSVLYWWLGPRVAPPRQCWRRPARTHPWPLPTPTPRVGRSDNAGESPCPGRSTASTSYSASSAGRSAENPRGSCRCRAAAAALRRTRRGPRKVECSPLSCYPLTGRGRSDSRHRVSTVTPTRTDMVDRSPRGTQIAARTLATGGAGGGHRRAHRLQASSPCSPWLSQSTQCDPGQEPSSPSDRSSDRDEHHQPADRLQFAHSPSFRAATSAQRRPHPRRPGSHRRRCSPGPLSDRIRPARSASVMLRSRALVAWGRARSRPGRQAVAPVRGARLTLLQDAWGSTLVGPKTCLVVV